MLQRSISRQFINLLLIASSATISINSAHACTRAVYLGPQNTVLTGRSMDWSTDVGSNIWVFAAGMKRDGAAGPKSIQWTSKYGSVITSFFDVATVDGINEKGLVANVLYLAESVYPTPTANDKRKPISIAAWAQYVLDNFATVTEVVDALRKEPFYVVQVETPDGHPGVGHLAVSDQSGDSAIFEYVDGKLVIHHDRKYQVMTNSPTFDQQLAINKYWQEIGGATMLPGTSRAADRFVRASYYIATAPQTAELQQSTAEIFAVIRNASAPYGTAEPGKPNIATTLWRTVSDQKNMRYYFDGTTNPDVFWIEIKDLNFKSNQTLKLSISDGQLYSGNAAKQLQSATPFQFLVAK
jgi:choloylglycine hydrolase